MEGLARLRPFTWFCQFCGFIPFRIELDPHTKTFERFSISNRRSFAAMWFASVKALFLGCAAYTATLLMRLSGGKTNEKNQLLPFISLLCNLSLFAIILLTVQFSMLRCSHLGKAIELIKKADDSLASVWNSALHRDSVILRTYISVFFIIMLVILNNNIINQ